MNLGTELLAALPVAVYVTDAEGRITFYNEAAAELWGHRPALGSLWCGSWRILWPDGRHLPHDECPMAITLKTGEPVRGVEAVAERPGGTRVPFMPYPTPIRDAEGRLTGAINLLIELGEKKKAEIESARLAAIVTSSDDAIVSKTLDGIVTSWNAGASRIFGYTAEEMVGHSILRIIPPELHSEETEILAKLRRGEHIDHFETVRVAKDGRRVDISLTVSPVHDRLGAVVGVSKVARDVTERKQAEALQRLLVNELDHRVKNTLATVQAIASQSLSRAKNLDDFVAGFSGRVQALAKAHGLLTQTRQQVAELRDLVREQVLLGLQPDDRIALSGPSLLLDAQTALHVGLILHELATNARKYGALSVAQGRLLVTWEVRANGGRLLVLQWQERGGPAVTAPRGRGFGTTLIQQTLQAHGGEALLRYAAEGLACEIKLPLSGEDRSGLSQLAPTGGSWSMGHEAHEAAVPSAGRRVFLVEDEPLVAMDLESTLIEAGCTVVGQAGTLARATQLAAETDCDLALIDANLGGQRVDELAALLARRNIPFAFVTGYGRDALPAAFRDAPVLDKPFDRAQLAAVVEQLIDRGRQDATVVPLRPKAL